MSRLTNRLAMVPKVLSLFVVTAVLVSLVVALYPREGQRHLTVDFPRTVSLYEGSDVRILGVPVGTVESIHPRGDVVRVRLAYSDEYKLPEDVKAAIVSPAIVGDRFVQLAPVYSKGPVLEDGAHLDTDRTATPVELDEVFQTLDDLAVAMGPEGANKDGALSRLVDSGAKTLDGEGKKINQTVEDLSKLSGTLSNNKEELFGSVEQVERFVRMLKANDDAVRAFNQSLAEVSGTLEGERQDLAKTLELLARTLDDVDTFVQNNRKSLRKNVHDLTQLTKTVVKQRKSLNEAFTSAPTALSNLAFTYNPKYGTLDNRSQLVSSLGDSLEKPGRLCNQATGSDGNDNPLCNTLKTLDPTTSQVLGTVLDQLPLYRPRPGGGTTTIEPEPTSDSLEEMLAVKP